MSRTARALLAAALAVTTMTACLGEPTVQPRAAPAIGFLFVGRNDDLGYNQAAWEGSVAVARAFPDNRVLRRFEVAEDERAGQAMEELINSGAEVIFATSFGYHDQAVEVARRHPDVVVVHQANHNHDERLPNFGSFYGTSYEPVYQAGIAAGATSGSGRLGMVVSFPIAPVFNTVNAFTLGARSVNPGATTTVRVTGSWCDPTAQAQAAADLLAAGVDVLAQHQDCTATVLRAADRAGVRSVGYHYDASDVVPRSWLTAAVWSWGGLYTSITRAALLGRFAGSPYNGNFRGRLANGDNPFLLSELAPAVPVAARDLIDDAGERFASGASPFDGPIVDRDGVLRVPAGSHPSEAELEAMDYPVDGVLGDLPGR